MANRRVLVAGATGLVGSRILHGALTDDSVAQVHVLARRALGLVHPKLAVQQVDFRALPPLPAVDEVYLALGTTIRQAGSRDAFRAVDLQANLAVAQAALYAGARRFGLVSAVGADATSKVFYNQVKGELEDALAALAPDALVIARPSFLLGDRQALGQAARPGERLGICLGQWLRPVLPAAYRPVEASRVAAALLASVPLARGKTVLACDQLQAFDGV